MRGHLLDQRTLSTRELLTIAIGDASAMTRETIIVLDQWAREVDDAVKRVHEREHARPEGRGYRPFSDEPTVIERLQ